MGAAESLPPAAKFIRHVLAETDGALTKHELKERTDLPDSTVTRNLSRLRDAGLVASEPALDQRRGYRYRFNG